MNKGKLMNKCEWWNLSECEWTNKWMHLSKLKLSNE